MPAFIAMTPTDSPAERTRMARCGILRLEARGAKWLNPIAMRISTRIMGLLLAAIAVQFMLNAIKLLKPVLLDCPP